MTVIPTVEPRAFQRAFDKTLHWTLSLYVDESNPANRLLDDLEAGEAEPDGTRTPYRGHGRIGRNSQDLRNAIDPLFNDIADRWQLGDLPGSLIATESNHRLSRVRFSPPARLEWFTEGRRSYVEPPGLSRPREGSLRTFWYLHNNGAASYHLAFTVPYEHAIEDYFFLSLLQKLCAPKEMQRSGGSAAAAGRHDVLAGRTGIRLLDEFTICATDRAGAWGEECRFWPFVRDCFDRDTAALDVMLPPRKQGGRSAGPSFTFETAVRSLPFIEIPGFRMPQARVMFFLRDKDFFRLLSPPADGESDAPPSRSSIVRLHAPERPAAASDAIHDPDQDRCLDGLCCDLLGDGHGMAWLQLLFLAGFNQNIVDFLHQDVSEILDSLDPIYPPDTASGEENFFVRYANPRAFITYVAASRSLEIGNDYIGTCPYAFLLHLASMHNEFLSADYADKGGSLVHEIRQLTQARRYREAAEKFYDFRMSEHFQYHAFRHHNIFRYDTEAIVFEALERIRGITRKEAALEHLIDGLEKQTRDLEASEQSRREKMIALGLGAVGFYGFVQVLMGFRNVSTGTGPAAGLDELLLWTSVALTLLVTLFCAVVFVPALVTSGWRKLTARDATLRIRDRR